MNFLHFRIFEFYAAEEGKEEEKKRGVEVFMVRLRALFLLFSLKEDFHGLIFIFCFVWVLYAYESWEIKNRGLIGIVGKEKEERNAKNAKYDFCIFCIFRIACDEEQCDR